MSDQARPLAAQPDRSNDPAAKTLAAQPDTDGRTLAQQPVHDDEVKP